MDIAKYYSDHLSTHLVRTFNPKAAEQGTRSKMAYMPSGSISIGARDNLRMPTISINKSGCHVKKLFKGPK